MLLRLSKPIRSSVMGYGIQGQGQTPDKVSAWLFHDRAIKSMDIDATEGIAAETFDEQIHSLNDTSDGIYYAYQQAQNIGEHG